MFAAWAECAVCGCASVSARSHALVCLEREAMVLGPGSSKQR